MQTPWSVPPAAEPAVECGHCAQRVGEGPVRERSGRQREPAGLRIGFGEELGRLLLDEARVERAAAEGRVVDDAREVVEVRLDAEERARAQAGEQTLDRGLSARAVRDPLREQWVEGRRNARAGRDAGIDAQTGPRRDLGGAAPLLDRLHGGLGLGLRALGLLHGGARLLQVALDLAQPLRRAAVRRAVRGAGGVLLPGARGGAVDGTAAAPVARVAWASTSWWTKFFKSKKHLLMRTISCR